MSESMKQFANEFVAAWNSHDADRVASYYAPDYVEVDVAQKAPERGRDTIRRKVLYYLRAFPDLHVTLDDCVAEDGRLALFWTWRGTHTSHFMNIPPSGRQVIVRGTSLLRLADGQIRQGLRVWDLAGLLRGVGLLPEL